MYRLATHKLKVDNAYYVLCNGIIRKGVLVRSTKRGFNFIDYFTNKMLFKRHFYPMERERDKTKELTFFMPLNIVIDKRPKNITGKVLDKFIQETTDRKRTDVLYDWIKENRINSTQFHELLHLI